MKYAFLSPDGRQCHPWILCRDFLHDALRNQLNGTNESIYGFHFDPNENPPLNLSKISILVKREPDFGENPSKASKNTLEILNNSLKILRCMEEFGGIKPLSKMFAVKGEKDVYLFEGAKDWMESTFMISLYTFFMRLGAKKLQFETKKELDDQLKKLTKSKVSDNDVQYLKSVRPYINKIIINRKKLVYDKKGERLFDKQNINMFHNYTGIVALAEKAAAKKDENERNHNKLKDLIELAKKIK